MSGHGLADVHVEGVDIWALLAINFDADEVLIQEAGHFRVGEGFPFHHMAPMAGGVANGEEYGFILLPGALKGFCCPWVPINGVVGVLAEVETLFVCQSVRHLLDFVAGLARDVRGR